MNIRKSVIHKFFFFVLVFLVPTLRQAKARIVLHNKAKMDEKAEFIGNK